MFDKYKNVKYTKSGYSFKEEVILLKITTEPSKSGLSIKVYIPKSELDVNKYANLTKDFSKDLRMQKTFRGSYSKAKKDLIIDCLYEIFKNYDVYNDIWAYGTGMKEIILSKLRNSLQDKLDDYQKESFDSISKIIFAVVFDEVTELKVDTVKEDYLLSEKDLLVSTIGSFGFGKTTLIKKILNFGDDFVFPLVDKGRTTISNCYFRGMLIKEKDGEKLIQGVPVEEYGFKNVIKLLDCNSFYQDVIAVRLFEAFKTFMDDKENIKELLSKFISYDKCKLDEFFGDIDEYLSDINENSFYTRVINEFANIYQKYTSNSEDFDMQTHIFENTILQGALEDEYANKIQNSILEIIKNTGNESVRYEDDKITFSLKYDDIGSIDDYYNIFVSNSTSYRGRLLRIIVKEIFTEIDLDTDEINKIPEIKEKYNSIVLIDTMGCGHTVNKVENASVRMPNNDIMENTALLNQCDVILLLENAERSMDKDILTQIVSLESFGYKSNTILVYSHYNQFLKNDFKDDNEREKYLLNTLNGKLKEAFYSSPSKAKIIYDNFTSEENKQLVFLKGLVPYVSESRTKKISSGSTRVKKNTTVSNEDSNDLLSGILNKGIEESTKCLIELFTKIVATNERAKKMSLRRITIKPNIDDASIMSFGESFNSFVDEYLEQQKYEYIISTPEYNTTGALCRALSNGRTKFEGVGRTLSPFNDSITMLMQKFSDFVENNLELKIIKDDEGNKLDSALKEEFIKDVVKSEFSQKIQKLYKMVFITGNRDRWINISNYFGSGVKLRRAKEIYEVISQNYGSEMLREQSWKMVKESINEMVEEYGSN